MVAMVFVGLPFAVRTVQPVLMELDPQAEEAAAVLGASRWFTFRKVILRALIPPMLTGFALAFARAVGRIRLDCLHLRQHADARPRSCPC